MCIISGTSAHYLSVDEPDRFDLKSGHCLNAYGIRNTIIETCIRTHQSLPLYLRTSVYLARWFPLGFIPVNESDSTSHQLRGSFGSSWGQCIYMRVDCLRRSFAAGPLIFSLSCLWSPINIQCIGCPNIYMPTPPGSKIEKKCEIERPDFLFSHFSLISGRFPVILRLSVHNFRSPWTMASFFFFFFFYVNLVNLVNKLKPESLPRDWSFLMQKLWGQPDKIAFMNEMFWDSRYI